MRSLLCCLLGLLPLAPALPAEPPTHLSLRSEEVKVQAGGAALLRIRLDLDEGWHTFPPQPQVNQEGLGPTPLKVDWVSPGQAWFTGPVKLSPLTRRFDPGFQMEVLESAQTAWLEVPIQVANGLPEGGHMEKLRITYQVCSEQRCLPATSIEVPVTLQVEAQGKVLGHQQPTARNPHGIMTFLWLATLAGAASLLTPCVFPMIPITVSFFTQRAEGGRSRMVRDALLYGAGIILTFSGLGLALALIFGATGIQAFATSPAVNLGLALLFLAFALNLFGTLSLRVPGALLNRLHRSAGQPGTLSVLMMGLTFSLTSFTCTVPFVGSALLAASQGEWFHPILGMLAFSSAFALPFGLLALFPSLLLRLPRSGAWMNHLKVVLGFLEVAAAMKFLSNADLAFGSGMMSREFFLAIWASCAGLTTLYLLGLFRVGQGAPSEPLGSGRTFAAVAFGALFILLASGLLGRPLGELEAFLPPTRQGAPSQVRTAPATDEGWLTSFPQALTEAQRSGKPIFIDFTGYTCTNCRWMEQNMFPRPAIAQRLQRFIRVRLHTDRPGEPELGNRRFQVERFNAVELPLYAILTPEAQVLGTTSFTRDEQAFLNFLESPGSRL